MKYKYVGWEYEGELHVYQSKRHLIELDEYNTRSHHAVCGTTIPDGASVNYGYDVCKRCVNFENKNSLIYHPETNTYQ